MIETTTDYVPAKVPRPRIEVEVYRGHTIYCESVPIPPGGGLHECVFTVDRWIGIHRSKQAARDYIDFRVG